MESLRGRMDGLLREMFAFAKLPKTCLQCPSRDEAIGCRCQYLDTQEVGLGSRQSVLSISRSGARPTVASKLESLADRCSGFAMAPAKLTAEVLFGSRQGRVRAAARIPHACARGLGAQASRPETRLILPCQREHALKGQRTRYDNNGVRRCRRGVHRRVERGDGHGKYRAAAAGSRG
jgi:hypothetical protein